MSQSRVARATRATVCIVIIMATVPLCGCKALLLAMNEDKMKDVPAECDKLAGQRVAVVVWADQSTLDADPFACDRTARAVQYFFRLNSRQKELKGTTFIDAQKVADLQERVGNTGPALSHDDVASRLRADVILRIDLFEYTTRPTEANGLILGRVSGNVAVQFADEAGAVYRSDVSASFPEDRKMGVLDMTDEEVLTGTLNIFGERVARKFYEHKEKY